MWRYLLPIVGVTFVYWPVVIGLLYVALTHFGLPDPAAAAIAAGIGGISGLRWIIHGVAQVRLERRLNRR